MSVRPWTSTSGLGSVSVIGRMRVPNPAANTMAVFGTGRLIGSRRSGLRVGIDRRWAKRPRQVVLIPDRKRPKQWMGEVAREVTLDPRQGAQILRLMITFVEAGEQAKNLGGALGSSRGIGGSEALGVEGWIGGRPAAHIEGRETHLEILRHVDARVLQERNDVVSRRPDHRVLKIDEADSLQALPFHQPMQVRRMIVAQRPGGGIGEDWRQE